jgi:hypothetical protein
MVERMEELAAQVRPEPFADFPALPQRQVPIVESRAHGRDSMYNRRWQDATFS